MVEMRSRIARPHNKALHQTRRGGAAASRPIVEARLAGEGWCSTNAVGSSLNAGVSTISAILTMLRNPLPGASA